MEVITLIIASALTPPEIIQQKLKKQFPDLNFYFFKHINDNVEILKQAEVLITYGEDLTEERINVAKQLKWIMVMSAGLEKMPFKAINDRRILVTNARGIHKIPMAEYTIAMILQYEKKIKLMLENEILHKWDRSFLLGELHKKTILILGAGAIGQEIARLAKAFNMTTIGVNRSGKMGQHLDQLYQINDLVTVLPNADYVVSVLPSTPETQESLTADHFKHMKKSAVFINLGRGDVVKDQILLEALEQKEIAHAVLDVFEPEPLTENHPFWKMDTITVTPHLSSKTEEYLPRAFEIFEENLHKYIYGDKEYINVIDPKRGY
jgi:phosphoglycerate dehydrogenase-like enzyme